MSQPRPILPGRFYLVTRRCSERRFLLRPDSVTNQVFLYCLAVAASRYGMEVLGWFPMSNHYHLVIYDPHGHLPNFTCHFNQMVAKALNFRLNRWESFWAPGGPTCTLLVDVDDVFDKLVYTLLNAVTALLVDSAGDWPGASSFALLDGREITVKRPAFFFRRDGVTPKEARLRLARLPELMGPDWMTRLRDAVLAKDRELRETRLAAGVAIVGRKEVRATSPFDAPRSPAPRRKLRPLVACRNLWRRIVELATLKAFRVGYRAARARLAAGEREVVFPPGTFALRRLGVVCATAS